MSTEEIKGITSTLEKIAQRLDKLEHVDEDKGTTRLDQLYGACATQPGDWPYVPFTQDSTFTSHLQRSVSSPSLLHTEAPPEGEENQATSQGGPRRPVLRPDQTGAPPPFAFTTPRFPQVGAPIRYPFQPYPMYVVDPAKSHTPPQSDYKAQYEAIRSAVGRVILDPDWMLTDSKTGISSTDRELAAIVARSAKHVETELKLMQELQSVFGDNTKVADLMDQLHIVQKAHIRYLQEEYSSLQIAGQYGQQAKSVFKSIRRSTILYTPAFVDDIKTVLSVTGAGNQQRPRQQNRFRAPRPPQWNPSFRPKRFGNPGFYQPRNVSQNRDDQE